MQYFSQKDSRWSLKRLPRSNFTMKNYGCYVSSIAMLAQVLPTALLISRNFSSRPNQKGYIISSIAARSVGLVYKGSSSKPAPKAWCIGKTRHYAPRFPTHFFLVNSELGLQIDPLDENPKPEPLKYKCVEYRLFDNIKLVGGPVKIPIKAVGDSINLTSEAWHLLEQAQKKLSQSNDNLRSL